MLLSDIRKKFVSPALNYLDREFGGISRGATDAIASKLYQPQIDAQNARAAASNQAILRKAQAIRQSDPSRAAKLANIVRNTPAPQSFEKDILGHEITSNADVLKSAGNLAGLATMGYSPGVKLASGKLVSNKIAREAAANALPKLAKASNLKKLVGYGAIRGVENALPNVVSNTIQGKPVKEIGKQALGDVAVGAAFNTVLSPKVVFGGNGKPGALKQAGSAYLKGIRSLNKVDPILDTTRETVTRAVKNVPDRDNIAHHVSKLYAEIDPHLRAPDGTFTAKSGLREFYLTEQAAEEGIRKNNLGRMLDPRINLTNEPKVKIVADVQGKVHSIVPDRPEFGKYLSDQVHSVISPGLKPASSNPEITLPELKGAVASPETQFRVKKPDQNAPQGTKIQNPTASTPQPQTQPLTQRIDDLSARLNGNDTFTATGTKGASRLASESRSIQEDASGFVNKALSSNNVVARKVAGFIKGLSGSSGRSYEQVDRISKYRGGLAEATQLMDDIKRESDRLLPDEVSRARVFSVMDPETAVGTKYEGLTETNLSPQEQQALAFYREVSDLINESSYQQGRISEELYQKGKGGNYLPRTYELYELPPEIQKASRTKADLSAYKQRKEFDEWKTENLIRDPGYALAKRFQQVHANKAIFEYGQWLSKQADKVSDTPRPDFVKLGDDKAWGELSGKYVRQDALDDIRGFHAATDAGQAVYDVLNAFDASKIRQFFKKTKTVYNPATRLGNQIGNRTFAFISGLNPITFEKNLQTYAKQALKNNDATVRFLRKNGVVGTDASRADLARSLASERTSTLKKATGFIEDTYGNADDHAKIAAFKTWIDKGYSQEEALRRVRQGFQDYSTVGRFYDLGAKTPVMGNAFVRFQADLGRILKNAALENPLRLATLAGGIMIMGDTFSKMSGETREDRKIRESRMGSPKLPFTDIPLAFQTPYGEINAARLFGMYSLTPGGGENTAQNSLSRMTPLQVPTNKEDVLKSLGSDVMVGPAVSLVTDTDFRGKSIADPNQTKYKKTTLTPEEQWKNRLSYIARSYNFPVANDAINVGLAMQGKPDQYGKVRTPAQAVARLGGVKVEEFGPKQAEAQRIRNEQFEQYAREDIEKQVREVEKQVSQGTIDQATADKRIERLTRKPEAKANVAKAAESQFGGAIKQSKADNKYYFYDSKNERVSADTKDKADLLYAREQVKTGSQDRLTVGTKVIVAAPDTDKGYKEYDLKDIESKAKDQKLTNDIEIAKRTNDYKTWYSLKQQEYQGLEAKIKAADKVLDADQILAWQNKQADIVSEVSKYQAKGGSFTSAKKAKKASVSLVKVPRANLKTIGMPKVSAPKIAKPPKLKKVKVKKVKQFKVSKPKAVR